MVFFRCLELCCFSLLVIRIQAGCLCAAVITSAASASSVQYRPTHSSAALTWDSSHLCRCAQLDLPQRPVACAGSDPSSRDRYNSPRRRSNQRISMLSPALESSRQSCGRKALSAQGTIPSAALRQWQLLEKCQHRLQPPWGIPLTWEVRSTPDLEDVVSPAI